MTKEKTPKYAVIDLEATNAGATAKIIQVGIVIVEDGNITDSYQTDVNPHENLSEHIKALTGITDQQLASAPEFSQVASTIFDLIKECIFVAHNVKFDANLLAEALFFEGYELRTPRVDTVELAQVFFPSLEKYNLSHLSQELQLDLSDAHTAIADAMATANLLLVLQAKIKSLPRETLAYMLRYCDSLLFESALVIEEGLRQAKSFDSATHYQVNQLVLRKDVKQTPALKLSQSFDINTALLGLENRPKQNQFVHLVEQAFHHPEASFIQAQAGIGKTYGYLLPLLARANGNQVLVSVPTKILQDQMVAKELQSLVDQYHLKAHSLKGPGNYIKLDAFQASLEDIHDNRLINRYKMQLLVWLLETQTGDLDEIKQKQRFAAYFDHIKHDGNVNKSSDFYDHDFWQRSYEKGKQADLLITNHAYFLHRVEDDKSFAKGKILVFDEAQGLTLQLDQLSRKQVNVSQLLQEIMGKLSLTESLLKKRLYESLTFELSQLANQFYQSQKNEVSVDVVTVLKTLVTEIDDIELSDLKEMFRYEDSDFWLSTEKNQEKRETYLNATTRQFVNFRDFLPETAKIYFISATLQISPQVSLADLLGYDHFSYDVIAKEKSQSQLVLIDQDMPILDVLSDQEYCQEIAKRIYHLKSLNYPILVLFNSRHHLLMVSELLDQWQVTHLCQEKNGTAYNIKKRFDRGEQSILLGMGAFWEGVDFIHADRMIEVITRLPFDNPKDPFVKKMSHHISSRGKQAFTDYFLPMTILKLKQAIGRTMRRDNQKSCVLILDKRIMVKSYGPEVFAGLDQEFVVTHEKFENCLGEMAHFLI
ncbi:bifunctional DnaQ family exonuclease/ATP-dependent helicase [Streptococcus hongkongensis]